MCVLDYDSVAAVDKFGSVFVLRLPEGVNDDIDVAAGARKLWDQGILNGAPIKLNLMAHYYLGEAATSITKTSLVTGGPEILLVTTITGALYGLLALENKDDIGFYQHLEMFMRQEFASAVGRDHLSYRSYFAPVKSVVDGEYFGSSQNRTK
jgi:splicing factor 3B subunit 3